LGLGARAEVIEPPSLRERVFVEMKAAMARVILSHTDGEGSPPALTEIVRSLQDDELRSHRSASASPPETSPALPVSSAPIVAASDDASARPIPDRLEIRRTESCSGSKGRRPARR